MKKQERVELVVKNIGASRGMYVDEDNQKVLLTLKTTDNQTIELEMSSRQAAKAIEGLLSVYNAINPPLRTSRGGIGL